MSFYSIYKAIGNIYYSQLKVKFMLEGD